MNEIKAKGIVGLLLLLMTPIELFGLYAQISGFKLPNAHFISVLFWNCGIHIIYVFSIIIFFSYSKIKSKINNKLIELDNIDKIELFFVNMADTYDPIGLIRVIFITVAILWPMSTLSDIKGVRNMNVAPLCDALKAKNKNSVVFNLNNFNKAGIAIQNDSYIKVSLTCKSVAPYLSIYGVGLNNGTFATQLKSLGFTRYQDVVFKLIDTIEPEKMDD